MNKTDWINEFSKLGALWIHDGVKNHPHALLTSGKHSSGFFNATKVIENPCVLQCACDELSRNILSHLMSSSRPKNPNVVVGSAFGAITIAHECAKSFSAKMAFTQKNDGHMHLMRFSIKQGEDILVVEDVMSTGKTTLKTIDSLEEKGAIISSVIGVLVNRSSKDKLYGRKIVSLIEHPMPMWEPNDCPLCKGGSKALLPKEHWEELTNP